MSQSQLLTIESEAGFKALFEYATVGIIVISRDGHIQLANPCVQKMFDYGSAELIGQPVEILVPHALRSTHEDHRERYFNKPKARPMGYGIELFARRNGGEEFPVEISLGHYQLDGENLAVAFVTDISERKRDREAQLQSEERFAKAFNSDPVAKSISRVESGEVVDVNESFLSLFDYTREEVIGRNTVELKMFKDEEERTLLITTLRNHGTVHNREMTVLSKNLKPIVILLSSELIKLNGKEHLLSTRVDITEKKRAEEALLKVNELLENKVRERTIELTESLERERELGEMKSRFVSMASHEFRTPLTSILSSVSLIEKYGNGEEEKRKKHINRIQSSVENLNDILNDFLSLDKLEQGKITVEKSKFDLKELMEDVLQQVNSTLKEGQKIIFNPRGQDELTQDKRILKNILLNLLSNAVKYSGPGKEITISVSIDHGKVTIEVIDQGIGIPESGQPHLFSKFYRAPNAMSIYGTGLGLNIVKRYLELMDGTITFRSKENEGTTFQITFPQ